MALLLPKKKKKKKEPRQVEIKKINLPHQIKKKIANICIMICIKLILKKIFL